MSGSQAWVTIGSFALILAGSVGLGVGVAATRDSLAAQPLITAPPAPDPAIGTSVESLRQLEPVLDLNEPARVTLLIVAGSCTGCSTTDLAPEAIDWKRVDRVVAVFQSDNLASVADLERRDSRWRNVADPTGKVAQALNGYWRPRFYLLGADATLLRLQSPGESASHFGVLR